MAMMHTMIIIIIMMMAMMHTMIIIIIMKSVHAQTCEMWTSNLFATSSASASSFCVGGGRPLASPCKGSLSPPPPIADSIRLRCSPSQLLLIDIILHTHRH